MVHMYVELYARGDAPWNARVTLAGPSESTMSQVPFRFDSQAPQNLTDESEGSTLWVRGSVVVMEEGRGDAASSSGTTRRKGVKG